MYTGRLIPNIEGGGCLVCIYEYGAQLIPNISEAGLVCMYVYVAKVDIKF